MKRSIVFLFWFVTKLVLDLEKSLQADAFRGAVRKPLRSRCDLQDLACPLIPQLKTDAPAPLRGSSQMSGARGF
ncbi:hypothetical protein B0X71_10395 [Planococcus lenghuensis]|uniref:Uncharacterized protein n=1 Tax=Planococcus lenghuensis TaxID=2213202 RepID=A0A1Q2KZ49_9BACL|nr:hypothetical protein B0X71_10395 [Planococcus lenghuensis]